MLYQNICICVDLSQYTHLVFEKALSFIKLLQKEPPKLSVLHVIEMPILYAHAFSEYENLATKLKTQAEKDLQAYLNSFKLPSNISILEMGSSKDIILEYVKKYKIDLLILGSHGIGGASHLVGSTASFVVAHAVCDTWVVHVDTQKGVSAEFSPSHLLIDEGKHPDPNRFGIKQHPIYSGSEKGVKQDVKRGPHLTNRPKGSPTSGQAHSSDSSSEDKDK